MAAVTAALIAATAIAAGTSAYSNYSASKAADDAKNVASKQEFEVKAAADDAAKQAQEQKDQQTAIDKQSQAQDAQNMSILLASRKRQLFGADSRGGTLLTGPQGVTTPGSTSSKTLLGS